MPMSRFLVPSVYVACSCGLLKGTKTIEACYDKNVLKCLTITGPRPGKNYSIRYFNSENYFQHFMKLITLLMMKYDRIFWNIQLKRLFLMTLLSRRDLILSISSALANGYSVPVGYLPLGNSATAPHSCIFGYRLDSHQEVHEEQSRESTSSGPVHTTTIQDTTAAEERNLLTSC